MLPMKNMSSLSAFNESSNCYNKKETFNFKFIFEAFWDYLISTKTFEHGIDNWTFLECQWNFYWKNKTFLEEEQILSTAKLLTSKTIYELYINRTV
jgi:hypothetical protein